MRRMSPPQQQNLFDPTPARSELSLPHRLKAMELLNANGSDSQNRDRKRHPSKKASGQ